MLRKISTHHPVRHFTLTMLIILLSSCSLQPKTGEAIYETMPEAFQKNGMISSSTYQVFVRTTADTKEKALINAEALAKTRAYELLLNESFTRIRVSDYGKKRLKKVIEENGKIVRLAHESKHKWGGAFQVNKIGLREYLQSIR